MACEMFLVPLAGVSVAPDRVRSLAVTAVPRDERWHVSEFDGGEFEIEMPVGEMKVSDSHVAIRLGGFSPEVARLMHAIAKQAKLAIVNEAGGPHILLADTRHLNLLPAELRGEEPTVCASASALAKALGPVFEVPVDEKREALRRRDELYAQWTRDHRVRAIGSGDPQPNLPGLESASEYRALYVELKPKEGRLLLLRRCGRFVRARFKIGQAMLDRGGMSGSGWQIRLPTGEVFGCLILSGYRWTDERESVRQQRANDWRSIVQEFADSTERLTARINNGMTVVVSDGRTYALAECESRRTSDEDG